MKECCKGHAALAQEVSGLSTPKICKRFASRLMSDAYGKGVVRGQRENNNLCIHAGEQDVTHAETRRTSDFEGFFGREFVEMVQRLNDGQKGKGAGAFPYVDGRNPKKKKVTFRDAATLYGQRPKHQDVWDLSPYEFCMNWKAQLRSYPKTFQFDRDPRHHAKLTALGKELLEEQQEHGEEVGLQPGVHYVAATQHFLPRLVHFA